MTETLGLFEGFGIELEYMLVDRETLAVAPVCDRVLEAAAGRPVSEFETGAVAWSNELALHVIEIKTNGPVEAIDEAVAAAFEADLRHIDALAGRLGARLMPTAMHPTMDPAIDAHLWPHDNREIYAAYDRTFGCSGHGWVNLQSCHLNLPFRGAEQFGALHAAIRPILPLLPGLAASSPIVEGVIAPQIDARLAVYAANQKRVPAIIGDIIPEPVFTPQAYVSEILEPMYADVAPLDPQGLLQHEWLNSRGAIARFDRGAIEIRLLDVQETPIADLAIARLVATVVQALTEERWVSLAELRELPTASLRRLLDRTIEAADEAVVEDRALLRALGCDEPRLSVGEVWTALFETLLVPRLPARSQLRRALCVILAQGPLSRRILRALGPHPKPARIVDTYRALAEGLTRGRLFVPGSAAV